MLHCPIARSTAASLRGALTRTSAALLVMLACVPVAHASSFAIQSPAAGAVLTAGQPSLVTWVDLIPNPGPVDFDISSDNGVTWQPLATSVADDGSEPLQICPTGSIRLRMRRHDDPTIWTTSQVFQVTSSGLPNFTTLQPGGWADRVVPSSTPLGFGARPAPASLTGEAPVYVDAGYANFGTAWPCVPDHVALELDGVQQVDAPRGPLGPGVYTVLGERSFFARGGLHTFTVRADPGNQVAESSETDNAWSRQWALTPDTLTSGGSVRRTAPASATGGLVAIPAGTPAYPNVDGLRMMPGAAVRQRTVHLRAFAVHPVAPGSNPDLRVFQASNDPAAAFRTYTATSHELGSLTDFVIVPPSPNGDQPMDVGVLNAGGADDVVIENREADAPLLSVGSSRTAALAADQMVAVQELPMGPSGVPAAWVEVQVSPPQAGIRLGVFRFSGTPVTRADLALSATTDAHGHAGLFTSFGAYESYGIVISRDLEQGTAPFTYTLRARPDPAELAFGSTPPVRVTTGGASPDVPPASLPGEERSTTVNFVLVNSGSQAVPVAAFRVQIDDAPSLTQATSLGAPGSIPVSSLGNPVRGGRHTVAVHLDPDQVVDERDEFNDVAAVQWAWTPAVLTPDAAATRAMPPLDVAGWQDLPAGTTRYYNCDGLRLDSATPANNVGWWTGGAVAATGDADIDLFAFAPYANATQGFSLPLAVSEEDSGRTELIVADNIASGPRAIDLGVIGRGGSSPYAVQTSLSRSDAFGDGGVGAVHHLPPGQLFALVELPLQFYPGRVLLDNLTGGADLEMGMFVQGAGQGLHSFADARTDGRFADANGASGDEALDYQPWANSMVVAIAKARGSDVGKDVTFRLRLAGVGPAAAGDAAPPAVRLAAISPNPFRISSSIAFELPTAQNVDLAVYDVTGQRVTTLASGTWAAGRHSVAWNGRDANGAAREAGMYFVQLAAGGVRTSRKLALIH